jgi:hypothetical protein
MRLRAWNVIRARRLGLCNQHHSCCTEHGVGACALDDLLDPFRSGKRTHFANRARREDGRYGSGAPQDAVSWVRRSPAKTLAP